MISIFIRVIMDIVSVFVPFPLNLPMQFVAWIFRLFIWWL